MYKDYYGSGIQTSPWFRLIEQGALALHMSDLQHAYSDQDPVDMQTGVMLVRELHSYRALLDLINSHVAMATAHNFDTLDLSKIVNLKQYAVDLKNMLH